MEPYRKDGDELVASLFVGRIRRLFVNWFGDYFGGTLAILWGTIAFVGLLPLMLAAYLLGDVLESSHLWWIALGLLVFVYPVLLYIWLGPIPCGLVVSAIVFFVVDRWLR